MPTPKSPLRLRLEKLFEARGTLTVYECMEETRDLARLPGVAWRSQERLRRQQTPDSERRRPRESWRILDSDHRRQVRDTLNGMLRVGLIERNEDFYQWVHDVPTDKRVGSA